MANKLKRTKVAEKFTTIAISESTRDALAKKKVHAREPWNDALKRLLEDNNGAK